MKYTMTLKCPVGEQSLTQIMMKTVRCAVEDAGAVFGEEDFQLSAP